MRNLKDKVYKRPDEEALLRILDQNSGKCAELVIRLVWNAGMNVVEARELKWEQVDFSNSQINLPNRTVPMEAPLQNCLQRWHNLFSWRSPEYVVISDLRRVRMTRVALSRIVSEALKAGGMEGITMADLRQDYVIRLMEQHDLPYVSRISGLKLAVLKANYYQYVRPSTNIEKTKQADNAVDEDKMIRLVKAEGVPLGIAIWLAWKQDMSLEGIVALTWDQIDLDMRILNLPSGYVFIDDTLDELLRKAREIRDPEDLPYVILSPKARKPFRKDRLSRVMREVLVHRGIEDTCIVDLKTVNRRKKNEDLILQYLEKKKYITMEEAKEILHVSGHNLPYECLLRLREQGKLTLVGARYYLAGTVVPPERQYETICAYLKEKGSARLGELAGQLGIESKQCWWILKGLVKEGKLLHEGHKYSLPK